MFTNVPIDIYCQISHESSIHTFRMNPTDTIRSFMEKATRKPEKYDFLLLSSHFNFWGFFAPSLFYKLDPDYTFEEYMLTTRFAQVLLNEKSKSKNSRVPNYSNSYKGYMLNPLIIAELNTFNHRIITDVFDEMWDSLAKAFFSSIGEHKFTIESFSSCSLPSSANFLSLHKGSIYVFKNDKPVFYTSLISTVYYTIPNGDEIIIVFRNGTGFIDLCFKCSEENIISIDISIQNAMSLFITNRITRNGITEVHIFLNELRDKLRVSLCNAYTMEVSSSRIQIIPIKHSNSHVFLSTDYHGLIESNVFKLYLNYNNISVVSFPINSGIIFGAVHPNSKYIYFYKNRSIFVYYSNTGDQKYIKLEKKASNCLGDQIKGIKVNTKGRVLVYSSEGCSLYESNLELIREKSNIIDYNGCYADISDNDNIVMTSTSSIIQFYGYGELSRSRMNLSLFPRTIKINDISISSNSNWLLITTSHMIYIVDCKYKDGTIFDTFPNNHYPPNYILTLPISLL